MSGQLIQDVKTSGQCVADETIRQILIQQPNRVFVRALAVSKDECILFHYDRSGVQYTPRFNIHSEPKSFLRALLAIVSQHERVLGFDTSIQWIIGDDGRKSDGKITVTTSKGGKVTYEMDKIDPECHRHTICGRGTTCWRAIAPNRAPDSDDTVIIKYSWQSEGRVPEYTLLEKAKGIPGIGQMIDYSIDRLDTARWRKSSKGALPKKTFHNRILTCIVLEGYGGTILEFGDQSELLCALRDGMAGA